MEHKVHHKPGSANISKTKKQPDIQKPLETQTFTKLIKIEKIQNNIGRTNRENTQTSKNMLIRKSLIEENIKNSKDVINIH